MAPRKEKNNQIVEHLPTVLPVAVEHTRRVPVAGDFSRQLDEELLSLVIENYLRYYASGAGHTARAKQYDLKHFLEFLAGNTANIPRVRISDWTMQATQDFIDHRLSLGEAPATVSRRLATIKHFGRTLAERVHGYINPAREVKSPTLQPNRPHGLSAKAISLLLAAADEEVARNPALSFLPLRNRFLLKLLLATGLRADEVRLLVLQQVSDDFQWLKNVKTKGRKFRNVYLDSQIRADFAEYLSVREIELTSKMPAILGASRAELLRLPVFISVHRSLLDKPSSFGLSPKTVWRIISAFGMRAQAIAPEIGNLHPHRLRHTFAHGLLDSSKDVRLVAQALGHSDVRTTMRYTERTEEQIAEAIEQKVSGRS